MRRPLAMSCSRLAILRAWRSGDSADARIVAISSV